MANNDDQNQQTNTKPQDDNSNVIPSPSKDEVSPKADVSEESSNPGDNPNNLPVEEAGQLESPKVTDESKESKEDSTPADDIDTTPHEDETERAKEEEAKAAPKVAPKDDSGGRWYVVHTYSGHENKVAATLKQRIESEHLEKKILDVLVPMQDKIEIKGGKRLEVKEKIFPGYILVKMILDDNTWLAVRTTQGVTSFVGIGNKPTPIPESEVQTIIKFTEIQHPTFKQIFAVDDTIKIVDGPFSDFIGKIESVDEEKGKVRVLVSIFGRETPVELDFLQVQKI